MKIQLKKLQLWIFPTDSLGENTTSYITDELTFSILKNKFIIVERDGYHM